MCERLGIRDVVDGHELNIAVVQRGAHDVAPDAAEAVDSYLDGHSSSGGVWDCGRASHANFSHAAKLKMLWAAPTKVNAAHDCSFGEASLRVLLNAGDAVAHESNKDCLGRRLAVNPVFDFVAVGIALANLVLGLADGGDHLFTVHTDRGPPFLNGLLHFRSQRLHPLHALPPLLRDIEEHQDDLLQ